MSPLPIRTALTLALLAASAFATSSAAQKPDSIPGLDENFTRAPRPTAPLTIERVCPFECCTYGNWTLRNPAALRSGPRRTSPVLAQLKRGQRVRSDSGIMHVDTIGVVAVEKDYANDIYHTPFQRGDTILVLDFLGEGQYNAWWRGYAIQVESFWDGPQWEPDPSRVGKIVQKQTSTWWAHVRDNKAHRGWIDMTHVSAAGADACG